MPFGRTFHYSNTSRRLTTQLRPADVYLLIVRTSHDPYLKFQRKYNLDVTLLHATTPWLETIKLPGPPAAKLSCTGFVCHPVQSGYRQGRDFRAFTTLEKAPGAVPLHGFECKFKGHQPGERASII